MKTTIKFPKNDSFAFFVTINKISKILDNAYFTVKENPDEEPVLQKKLGAGISLADSRLYKNQLSYKVQIDGADTKFMEVGVRYLFDVKGTIGNAQKTFILGELILSETETGYLNPAIQGDTAAVAQVYAATFETGAQSQYVETEVDPVATAQIGSLSDLKTTAKATIVAAVNEVAGEAETANSNISQILDGTKKVKNAEHADTAANADNVKAKSGSYKELADALLEMIYPVGSIKLTTENKNPSTYLGGTWVAWGAGRVPVGVDETTTKFKTAEKTGGSETATLPYHTHDAVMAFDGAFGVDAYDGGNSSSLTPKAQGAQGGGYVITISRDDNRSDTNKGLKTGAAGVSSASNLQPYITCYMWKRTA